MASTEAVKVLESFDDNINSEGGSVRKIRTISCYKGGPSLEKILLDEDVRDLTLLVFSIAGKTRGGKSFLLNLMIKHLEYLERKRCSWEDNQCSEVNEDWLSGKVSNGFTWKNGIQSVTRGLWIFPKIFRLKDKDENEVGILLLDTEGMHDGEATDGEIIAMSGISAAISYKQIFNMKEKITGDYLESVVRSLIKGIEELDSEETKLLKEEYKLLLVVRDWIGEDDFPFGMTGGKEYIKSEKTRGTSENQQLWTIIQDTFHDIDCVLLPNPGKEVLKKAFNNSGDLQMLDEEFLIEVKRFIQHLFRPGSLVPPSTPLTCQDIYRILKSIDGKVADEDLSFLHILTDHGNFVKVEKWKTDFEDILKHIVSSSQFVEAKTQLFGIIKKAERTLKGRSQFKYLDALTKAIEGAYNQKVAELTFLDYKSYFGKVCIEKQHRDSWHNISHVFQNNICGDNATRQNANLIFMKKAAALYYNLLREEHQKKFQEICDSKKMLDECAGLDEREIKSFKECEDFFNDTTRKELIYPIWLKEFQSLKKEYMDILLKHISGITGVSEETLKTLRNKQYEHFENFTLLNKDELNLDSIPKNQFLLIAKKVGFALFGLPSNTSGESPQGTGVDGSPTQSKIWGLASLLAQIRGPKNQFINQTGYSKNQESKIFQVVEKICSLSSDPVKFSCIFLVYEKDSKIINVPIFRIHSNGLIKFMDSNCSVYTGWNDFLKLNTLPDIFYCHPLSGSYIKEDGFAIAFSKTPASKLSNRVFNVFGRVGAGAAIMGGVAAFASPAVAFVATPAFVLEGALAMAVGADTMLLVGSSLTGALAGITSLFFKFNVPFEFISSLEEVEEILLRKILFYFNATSQENALEVIRDCLKLERNCNKVDALIALVKRNCFQCAVETTSGDIKIEKYVSQNTAAIVNGLMTSNCFENPDIVLHYIAINEIVQINIKDSFRRDQMFENIMEPMQELYINLQKEMPVSQLRLNNFLSQNLEQLSQDSTFIQLILNMLEKEDGHQLVMAFRYLTCSLSGIVRKANKFYSNILHNAITLRNHYLSDIPCHPLREVTERVKEIVEQLETVIDLKTTNIKSLNLVLLQVLDHIKQIFNDQWTIHQFARCLVNITDVVIERSDKIFSKNEDIVVKRATMTCDDLTDLFQELDFEGKNYGLNLLKKVVSEVTEDLSAIKKVKKGLRGTDNLLVVPAWGGIFDNLYCYCSNEPVCEDIIQEAMKIQKHNNSWDISKLKCVGDEKRTLRVIYPGDDALLSIFVKYSVWQQNKKEWGFILEVKSTSGESNLT